MWIPRDDGAQVAMRALPCASHRRPLPAFCQIPSAVRPCGVGIDALAGCLITLNLKRVPSMRADPSLDPNAELREFEPLRVVLALTPLLLAVLLSLQ
jgi:hypothetical protein